MENLGEESKISTIANSEQYIARKKLFKAYKEKAIKLNSRSSVIRCSASTLKKNVLDAKVFASDFQNIWIKWLLDTSSNPLVIDDSSFDMDFDKNIKKLESQMIYITDEYAILTNNDMLDVDETRKNLENYKIKLLNDGNTEDDADIEVEDKLEKLIDENKRRDYIIKSIQEEESKKDKELKKQIKRFEYIDKRSSETQKQSGTYTLYAGYKFISGQLDKVTVNAPLFFIPIIISKSGRSKKEIVLKHNTTRPIILNKPLLIMIEALTNTKVKSYNLDIDSIIKSDSIADEVFENTQFIKEINKDTLQKIEEIYNGNLNLTLYNASCIGIFNVSTSIYDDYSKLEERTPNKLIDKLIYGTGDNSSIYEIKHSKNDIKYKTQDLCLISPLDSSQECAVYMASKSNGLVIYGPPGTGKSQVITNIVADALSKNKKILLVSEKKTALDVVHNRLARLNKYAMLLADSGDIESFKNKLNITKSTYLNDYNNNLSERIQLSNEIEENLQKLDMIYSGITNKIGKTDKSLSQLFKEFNSSDYIDNIASEIYTKFKEILEISYENLRYKLSKINNEILDNFELSQLDISKLLASKTMMDIKIIISNIKEYKSNIDKLNGRELKQLQDKLNMTSMHKELWDSIIKNCYIDSDLIIDESQEDNNEYNGIEDDIKIAHKLLQEVEKLRTLKINLTNGIEIKTKQELNDRIDNIYKSHFKDEYNNLEQNNNQLDVITDICNKINSTYNINIKDSETEYSNKDVEYNIELVKICIEKINKIQKEFSINNHDRIETYFDKLSTQLYAKYKDILYNIDSTLASGYDNSVYVHPFEMTMNNIIDIVNNVDDYKFKPKKLFRNFNVENKEQYIKLKSAKYIIENKLNQELEELKNDINLILNSTKNILLKQNAIICINDLYQSAYYIKAYLNIKIDGIKADINDKTTKLYNQLEKSIDEFNNQDKIKDIYISNISELLKCDKKNIIGSINFIYNKLSLEKNNLENEIDEVNKLIYNIEPFKNSEIYKYIDDIDKIDKIATHIDTIINITKLDSIDKSLIRLMNKYSKDDILKGYMCANIYMYKSNELDSAISNYEDLVKDTIIKEKDKVQFTISDTDRIANDYMIDHISKQNLTFQGLDKEISKKRKVKTIRELVGNYFELLRTLYPIWMLTPEVVSDILPLQEDLFDIVIFDEASQMYLEKAIPSLYRAKNAIVAGDDKQLRPSNFFETGYITDETEDILDETTGKNSSLLDQAKLTFSSVSLMFHYRAKYAELIQFSNYAYYNSLLKLAPNVIKDSHGKTPIVFENVYGIHEKGTNEAEAIRIAEIVKEILLNTNYTIGIITLNSQQKELIDSLLDEYAAEDKDKRFVALLSQERNRVENNEDVGLFVKSIEEVQGDERDVIIISVDRGYDKNGKLHTSLGPIALEGGENRLNVAISRAKCMEYVITSLEPEDFSVEKSKNNGPKLFKDFLKYARAVSRGDKEQTDAIIYSGQSVNKATKFESPFEEQVYVELTKLGWYVETQVGVRGYRIDLAVYDKDKGKYLAGIECDGATYHSSKSARERDISRQRFLESRGWNILRIWSRDWWKNSVDEINRINQALVNIRDMEEIEDKEEARQIVNRIQVNDSDDTSEDDSDELVETNITHESIIEVEHNTKYKYNAIHKSNNNIDNTNCTIIDIMDAKTEQIQGYKIKGIRIGNKTKELKSWHMVLAECLNEAIRLKGLNWVKVEPTCSKFISNNKSDFKKPVIVNEQLDIWMESKKGSVNLVNNAKAVLKSLENMDISVQLLIDDTELSSKSEDKKSLRGAIAVETLRNFI